MSSPNALPTDGSDYRDTAQGSLGGQSHEVDLGETHAFVNTGLTGGIDHARLRSHELNAQANGIPGPDVERPINDAARKKRVASHALVASAILASAEDTRRLAAGASLDEVSKERALISQLRLHRRSKTS